MEWLNKYRKNKGSRKGGISFNMKTKCFKTRYFISTNKNHKVKLWKQISDEESIFYEKSGGATTFTNTISWDYYLEKKMVEEISKEEAALI